jgi:hypothetical protein
MRFPLGFAATVLAGCSLGGGDLPAVPDAAPDAIAADAPPDGPFVENRMSTGVVVDGTRVAWSFAHPGCPLDSDEECPGVGPTIATAELAVGAPTTRFSDLHGVFGIAGEPDELFAAIEGTYLARIRPFAGGDPEPLSPVVSVVYGPAVDATHVYWAEGTGSVPNALRRALRDGDGSDATTIASLPTYPIDMEVAGGYVWWWRLEGVTRVPVTGGSLEGVLPAARLVGRTGDVVYACRVDPTDDERRQILVIGAAGVPDVLVDDLSLLHEPAGPIATDGTDLYWFAANSRLVHLSTVTGTIVEMPEAGFVYGVLALVPGAILLEFTRDGYRTIPR